MRFGLLGPIQAEHGGSMVPLGGPQQRRLLGALLAARGGAVSVDRLVEVLWPDGSEPDGAARSAMTYVSRLRAALGDGALTTVSGGYRVEGDLDADEFEAGVGRAEQSLPDEAVALYDRALSLWRGPAFGELGNEWWALGEAARLGERRSVARERRAAALMAIGHHDRALPDLQSLAVEEPLRERPVMLLMQALNTLGRQAEALRAYQQFRERLGNETGLDPSADLVELERLIVAGEERTPGGSGGGPLRGYTILDVVGEGGFGRVYSAIQPGTQRKVAIKAIRPDLADSADFVRRFETEARLVARLEHPHIVPLYDYWREPGAAYLVFRFLGGGTARQSLIAGGPWSLARTSRLVEEVGGALIAAHAAGVTHNDVKPSNVMLDDAGSTYLTDFGIAVSEGLPSVDAVRRDTRCLGWLVWELLSGSWAGAASGSTSVSGYPPRGPAPSLLGRAVAVPEGVDAVLARATSPERCYSEVAEFLLAWRSAVGRPEGVLSPVTSTPRPASDSARRLAARQLAMSAAAGVNPYKGLRPFDEADAGAFYGRDAAIDEVRAVLDVHRMVAVVGASGSGKSSLVRAGLVPRLRAEGCVVVVMLPGDDPIGALRMALSEVATRDGAGLDPVAELAALAERASVVLVIDQFEECWTRADEGAREVFLNVLLRTPVRVVTTVRADMLDRPLEHTTVGPLVAAGAYVLPPMSASDLEAVVARPCAAVGVSIDEGLVADLVAETLAQPGSLPLLQFVLTELFDRRLDARIGNDTLVAVGGMSGAIGRRAEEVYCALDDADRAAARELFGRLVVPGDGVPDSRRRARLSELSPPAQAVAERFVAARLLVGDRHPATREPTLEVAHEALLARWQRLAGWIADDRRWLLQLQHLAQSATAWEDAGRGEAELYRGARLEAAIEALEAGRTVTASEREFVEAGRQARDADVLRARRSARRLRRLLTGVAALLVLAVVAGSVAFVQRRRATDARRETASQRDQARLDRLVAESERLLPSQLDLAGLLAVEARRRSDAPNTRGALLTALAYTMPTSTKAGIPSRFLGYIQPAADIGDGGMALDLSDDGKVLAVTSYNAQESQIAVYDVASHRRLAEATTPLVVQDLDLGADGRTVVGLLDQGDKAPYGLVVLDVATGASTTFDTVPWMEDSVNGFPYKLVRLLSDGTVLIMVRQDGELTSWDPAAHGPTGRTLPPGPFHWFDVTADGTLVTVDLANTTVAWFDLATGATVRSQALEAVDADLGDALFAVSPDGSTLAIAQWQGPLFLWDLTTGKSIPDAGGRPDSARSLDFDPADPAVLAVTTTGGALEFFDTGGNAAIGDPVRVHGNGMRSVAFDASGRSMAAFADDRRISLWGDSTSPGLVDSPFVDDPEFQQAVATPDGKHVLVFGNDAPNRAEIRRTQAPSEIGIAMRPADGADAGYYHAAFDADGRRVLLGAHGFGDREVVAYVADAGTGAVIWTDSSGLLARDISPDGSLVVVNNSNTVELWDIDANRRVAQKMAADLGIPGDIPGGIEFTADGKFVDFVAIGGAVRLSVPDLRLVHTVTSRRSQCTVAHMPGSDLLASMDGTGRVSTFDLAAGQLVATGTSRDSTSICGVGASPDGSIVAAQHFVTHHVALFDGKTMRAIGTPVPVGDAGHGWATPTFPDAAHMIFASPSSGLASYDLDPDHWQADVCQQAGRNLTIAEWTEYIGADEAYRATCPQWPVGT